MILLDNWLIIWMIPGIFVAIVFYWAIFIEHYLEYYKKKLSIGFFIGLLVASPFIIFFWPAVLLYILEEELNTLKLSFKLKQSKEEYIKKCEALRKEIYGRVQKYDEENRITQIKQENKQKRIDRKKYLRLQRFIKIIKQIEKNYN